MMTRVGKCRDQTLQALGGTYVYLGGKKIWLKG